MNKKDIINWDNILLNYKVSVPHVRWICTAYNFTKAEIPKEFLDSLVCCKITPTNPTNISAQQNYNFVDYKGRTISLPLNTSVWVPSNVLQLIKDSSLQLTDEEMRELYNPDVTTNKVKFKSSERYVNAFDVDEIALMKNLKRNEKELKAFKTEVNKVAAEHAAKLKEQEEE